MANGRSAVIRDGRTGQDRRRQERTRTEEMLVAIRSRSRISEFAIGLAHKKVTHKVGQKERERKKPSREERKIEKLLAAIALKLAADAACNVCPAR